MQRCPGYPHPNVIEYFEVLQLPKEKGAEHVATMLPGAQPASNAKNRRMLSKGVLKAVFQNVSKLKIILNPGGVVIMELAGGGSLSATLYHKVSAESTLGGRRTELGDVPRIPDFWVKSSNKWPFKMVKFAERFAFCVLLGASNE